MSESCDNSQTDLNNSQNDNADLDTNQADNADLDTNQADNADLDTNQADNADLDTNQTDNADLNNSEKDNADLNNSPNDNADLDTFQEDNDDLNPPQDDNVDLQDEKFRKLFIGGLDPETSEETLKQHFEQWGEVVHCVVLRHAETKQSRGFGFISYKTAEMLDDAQKNRPHKIDDREVDSKRATPRSQSYENQPSVKKLFVGGLKDETEDDIRAAFSRFGKVEKLEMITDRNTGKQKSYCFLTFDDFDSVDQCVLREQILVNGKYVRVNKAISKGRDGGMINEQRGRGGFRGSMRSRGGNRGNYNNNYGYDGNQMRGGRCFRRQGGRNWGGFNGGYSNNGDSGCDFNDGYNEFGFGYGSRYGGGPTFSTGPTQRNNGPYGSGYGSGRMGRYRH